jgi:26S proteasome regulatory subunit N6
MRLIEPFSTVELAHIAKLIELDAAVVERKISQMILDNKLRGILDQGNGFLIVHEQQEDSDTMEKGVELIGAIGTVVDNLNKRALSELMMR